MAARDAASGRRNPALRVTSQTAPAERYIYHAIEYSTATAKSKRSVFTLAPNLPSRNKEAITHDKCDSVGIARAEDSAGGGPLLRPPQSSTRNCHYVMTRLAIIFQSNTAAIIRDRLRLLEPRGPKLQGSGATQFCCLCNIGLLGNPRARPGRKAGTNSYVGFSL